jgi:hypothetical protein
MKVGAAVSPSIEVNSGNSSEGKNSSLDVGDDPPKLQRRGFGEIRE